MGSVVPNSSDKSIVVAAAAPESPNSSGENCSVCLELVVGDGRSHVRLACGHEFHLDCIGNTFNIRRAMQCPNCRNTEEGRWIFPPANSHDDDIFDYMDEAFGVQLLQLMVSQLSPSTDHNSYPIVSEGNPPSSVYQALLSRYSYLAANAAQSPEPQPQHQFSYYNPTISTAPENHWLTSYVEVDDTPHPSFYFPPPEARYPNWERHAPPHLQPPSNRENLSASQLLARFHSNLGRPNLAVHPLAAPHSATRRASNGIQATQPFIGLTTGDPHLSAMQVYEPPQMRSPPPRHSSMIAPARHSTTHRSAPQSSDPPAGYYVFPANQRNSLDGWETVHLPPASNNGGRENEWGAYGRAPSHGR